MGISQSSPDHAGVPTSAPPTHTSVGTAPIAATPTSHPEGTLPPPPAKHRAAPGSPQPRHTDTRDQRTSREGAVHHAAPEPARRAWTQRPGAEDGLCQLRGLPCSCDQPVSLASPPMPAVALCPISAMILRLHICTRTSGGPAWLLPVCQGTSAGQAGVTRGGRGSAPCPSLFHGKGLGCGSVNCSFCSCWRAAHCEVPDAPAQRWPPPSRCLHAPAGSRTDPGLQAPAAAPAAHQARSRGCLPGVFQTSSHLDNRMQPCLRGTVLGAGEQVTCVPTPETLSVQEATCAHAGAVAGAATVGSSEEQRCKRPPPRAAISAAPSNSEGSSKPGGPCQDPAGQACSPRQRLASSHPAPQDCARGCVQSIVAGIQGFNLRDNPQTEIAPKPLRAGEIYGVAWICPGNE